MSTLAARPRRLALWTGWLLTLLAAYVAMLWVRPQFHQAHVALVFLLVVLGGSAGGGRPLGLTLSGTAFLLFNWSFLPPYNTLVVDNPLDWLVLVAFLVTSVVAAQLLARAQREAEDARRRADEIDRLAAVGAETLNAARAEEALAAITDVIRTTLDVSECAVSMRDTGEQHDVNPPTDLVEWVSSSGTAAAEWRDGTVHLGDGAQSLAAADLREARAMLLPLRVRTRTVGVLRVGDPRGLRLDPARRRVLTALAYYAALAVDRARLSAEAERAEALREADRLKDALLASVSHDLRTPLTTIKALAYEIARGGEERAEVIVAEAERLNRTVADLLDLSRLNGGALPLALELNAADDLLGAVIERTQGALGTRRLDVKLEERGELLFGRFDFVHSLRVLVNLVENAVKYAPPDEAITLVAHAEEEMLVFDVLDRGPGIAPAEQAHVFEPFYRPARAVPDAGSAGLGLAIARRLAEAQGGSLDYSAREGGGARFTLRLPAVHDVASQHPNGSLESS